MLSCTAQACIADETAIGRTLEYARSNPDRSEYLLAQMGSLAEMARVAVGYAQQLGATGRACCLAKTGSGCDCREKKKLMISSSSLARRLHVQMVSRTT